MKVRLPGFLVLAVATVALGVAPLLAPLRHWAWQRLGRLSPISSPAVVTAAAAWTGVIILWILIGALVPSAFQALIVEPNEITYEKSYIAHNIRLTRHGFGLDKVEQHLYPAREDFTRRTVKQN